MNLFDILAHYFWLLCLAISGFNYFVGERAVARSGAGSLEGSEEAKVLRRRFAIVAALPWVVMGVGMTLGGVPDVWYYFRPQDQNPYVWAWFGSVFLIAFAFAWWVFFRDGAAKIISSKAFGTLSPGSNWMHTVGRVKFFAALGPIWIAVWIAIVVSTDVHPALK
ncbi:hypothetical protein [Paraburkholderia megapolitana]|uniref:Uncharacterized protein n=1 Tax=Paraburkholderia megapolitana TaxID=420953 RepID=A0A1I3IZQ8_9BURK|nr:hypothetical protein [Paraburkholderia megapolitana]QDQ84983.1 hypothetical protein FNZ07_28520 [Paraburkholderia megapolitana]SFI53390.1 hypothetical protein SAMN05192543_103490 [Paraburkholderia megapolitana]